MGVKGMKTLVADTLEDVDFKDSAIIIDGPNLYYSLYFNSKPKLDQQHGGDYFAFRDLVCRFFSSLKSCNVTPLVVLDGGAEPVKNKTIGYRLKDKLQKAKRLSESRAGEWDNILPPLVKDVFIQVLQELQVEILQCFGEADLTAALRANERKCPVLSNDSDFYIFDVQEGFLSIDGFQWESVTQGAIPAQRYRISQFCRCFNVDEEHMPVFAALSGNDYSQLEKEDSKKLIGKYPDPQQPGGSSAGRQRAILRFLGGFRGKTPEEAVTAALQLVGRSKQEDIKLFLNSAEQYALKERPRPYLPQWVIQEIQRGRLTSFVTSVVTQKSMTLTPLVEDFSQPSSYSASLRIRQFFYGLLLGTEPCTEYDREGAEDMRPKQVKPVLAGVTSEELQKLELEHLNEAPEDLRRTVLYEALGCSGLDIEKIPDQLKLPLCVTRFWYQNRQQNPLDGFNMSCLQALVLGFLQGNTDGGETQHEHLLQAGAAHAFSRWLTCLRQSLHLNQLLCFPLPEPHCCRLYCGPWLHQLQNQLLTDANAFKERRKQLQDGERELLDRALTVTQSAGQDWAGPIHQVDHIHLGSPGGCGPPRGRGPPGGWGPPRGRGSPGGWGPPRGRGPPGGCGPARGRGSPGGWGPPRGRGSPGGWGPPRGRGPPGGCGPARGRGPKGGGQPPPGGGQAPPGGGQAPPGGGQPPPGGGQAPQEEDRPPRRRTGPPGDDGK